MKKRKTSKRIHPLTVIGWVALAIIIIVMGYVGGTILIEKNKGNELPMPFGIGMSVVLSGSMDPELKVNDLIFVRKTDEIKVGQVVVFQTKTGVLTVHRIVKIEGDTVTTKGDANTSEDPPITKADIKGEVFFVSKGGGRMVSYYQSPWVICGYILGIMLVIMAFMVDNDVPVAKPRRKRRRTSCVRRAPCGRPCACGCIYRQEDYDEREVQTEVSFEAV